MKSFLPDTQARVEDHTANPVKRALKREEETRLAASVGCTRAELTSRIAKLDQEWDIERTLQANMGVVLLTTVAFSLLSGRGELGPGRKLFAAGVAGSFLQHALQGWCPPLVPWRSAGVRSAREIQEERTALQIMRGDFKDG